MLSFEEMLLTAFNMFVIMLTASVVTDEYRSGKLRLVMLRAYSFGQIFWAKTFIVLLTMFLLVAFYFVCSYFAGYWMFPHTNEFPLFYHNEMVDFWSGLTYNLAFYPST